VSHPTTPAEAAGLKHRATVLSAIVDAVLLALVGVPSCALLLKFANTTNIHYAQHISIENGTAPDPGSTPPAATGPAATDIPPAVPAPAHIPDLPTLLAATPRTVTMLQALSMVCAPATCRESRGWLRATLRRLSAAALTVSSPTVTSRPCYTPGASA
jgi:hypothetical protein